MQSTLTAIFPGTFDPITYGHTDLITRASYLFPRLIVAVAQNPNKKALFTLNERVDLVSLALEHLTNIEVIGYKNLMADFAKEHNSTILVRGVRSASDFEYERQLAEMNRHLYGKLETIFLVSAPDKGFISSTLVKDVALHHGDISALVPKHIETLLLKRLA